MRFLRNLAIILLLLTAVLAVTLTASKPKFSATAPQPTSMALVKNAIMPLREKRDATQAVTIHLTNRELEAASALAGKAVSPAIISSTLADETWLTGISYPLPLGRWLNIEASVPRENYTSIAGELPPFKVKVGAITLPSFLSKPLFKFILGQIQKRYAEVPNPDQVVKALRFSPDAVEVTVIVPRSGDVFRKVADWSGRGVNDKLVKHALCHLVNEQNISSNGELYEQVRRAFSVEAVGSEGTVEERNRASLVALAIFVGGARAQRVFYTDAMKDSNCTVSNNVEIKLGGRADLAKHWTVSAAMAATLGVNVTDAVGEWKELSDSLPQGTGFSFVDIAADRSGFRFGSAATDPKRAQAVQTLLARATDTLLLPVTAAQYEENMSDRRFTQAYSNLASPEYKRMIEQIERELDKNGIPK